MQKLLGPEIKSTSSASAGGPGPPEKARPVCSKSDPERRRTARAPGARGGGSAALILRSSLACRVCTASPW